MKKQSVQFFLFYFLYNAALVIYNNYIPLYYRTVCGFSQTQIGTVVSAGPLATVFGMFFFGRLADRMKNRNLLAGILLFLSGALTALYTVTVSFGFFVVLFFVFTLVNAPVLQLADTSAVIFAAQPQVSFGNLRLGGSIGYAVTSLVCGYLSARSSQSLFGVALAAYAAAAVAAFLLPHDRQRHTPSNPARTKKAPYRALFCKDIFLLAFVNFFGFVPIFFWNTFCLVHLADSGAPKWLTGSTMFVACLSEMAFLLAAKKLEKKLSVRTALVLSLLITCVRYTLYGLTNDPYAYMFLNLLQSGCHVVIAYFSAVCIRKHVPDSLQASGQTLIGLVNYGAAKFTANFFGGRLNHAIGYEGCMLVCGISAGIAALLVCALARRYRLFEEKANTEAS